MIGNQRVKKLLVIVSAFVLTACGGGSSKSDSESNANQSGTVSSSSSAAETVNGIPSNFVGVWDSSTDEGVDGFDELYVAIDASGNISSYDFAGDTFDDWGNCYWIDKNTFKLKSLGGSKYLSTETYPGSSGAAKELEIKVSSGVLTITGKDVDDLDDDGNTTENYTNSMKKSTKTVQSFTPECTDSFAVARSLIPAKQQKSLNLAK